VEQRNLKQSTDLRPIKRTWRSGPEERSGS
jgi:hypothetical protein